MSVSSRSLVDPELADLLESWPTPVITNETLKGFRAMAMPLQGSEASGTLDAVVVETCLVPRPNAASTIPMRIYSPSRSTRRGCIFHIHGGGYVGGEASALDSVHRKLTSHLGCVLVSVDYRRAPETKFPGNLEDCYVALSWLFQHARDLNVESGKIGLMGESAGGGLAAALALLARDRAEPSVAFQHLTYPMLDDRTCVVQDPHPFAGEFIWTSDNNRFGWFSLLGVPPGSIGVPAYAAPARAENLTGLPPTFISVGALDLFLEENIEYARRLSRAGVPVEMHVYPGAFHGFDFHPTAWVARAARRNSVAALERFLAPAFKAAC